MKWTTEQIITLAPDASSAKAGKALASARAWQTLGANEQTVWGLFQGSGKTPYQTKIDLTGPALDCSCPSRKFPCKHGLGLFLLLATQSAAFKEKEPPDWVAGWLASRAERAEKRVEKQAKAKAGGKVVNKAAQAKRAAEREAKVTAGLQELELWLRDIVRGGLAAVQSQPATFWTRTASRMVDAQAPGIARMARQLAGVAVSGEGWESRLLERLGRLYLLIQSFNRIAELPEASQSDIRATIGWTRNQDELLIQDGTRDRWMVVGQRVEEEDKLKAQRAWLRGEQSGRDALIMNYAAGNQLPDSSLVTGSVIDAELVFFPGAYQLRAIVKQRDGVGAPLEKISGYAKILDAHQAFLGAISVNQWLEKFPMPLLNVTPLRRGDTWFVRDTEDRMLKIAPGFEFIWTLLAVSGGHPIDVFSEWDGDYLLPLSAFAEGRFVTFG